MMMIGTWFARFAGMEQHSGSNCHLSDFLRSVQFSLHDDFVGDVILSLHQAAKEFGHIGDRPGDDVLRPHYHVLEQDDENELGGVDVPVGGGLIVLIGAARRIAIITEMTKFGRHAGPNRLRRPILWGDIRRVELAKTVFQVSFERHVVTVPVDPSWDEVGRESDDAAVC